MKRKCWSLVAAALLIAGGCGNNNAEGSGQKKTVVLATYAGYALPKEAAAAFTKRTGIKIKVVTSADAGTALSAAILAKDSPRADVFFGVDNTLLARAQSEGLFAKFEPKSLSTTPKDAQLDTSGSLTPIDSGYVCVNADSKWFEDKKLERPTDLESLADPRFKDLLVVQNPALSSPGLAFLMGSHAVFGPKTDDYWTRLKANGVAVAGSWDDAWNQKYSVNGGDRPLVVSYSSSPPAEVVYSEGKLSSPQSVVLADTCVRQVEFAGVLKGASNRTAAEQLVEEMLSPTWQAALPLSNFVYPIVESVKLPEEFEKWAQPVPHPIELDPAEIGAQRESWIDQWRSIME